MKNTIEGKYKIEVDNYNRTIIISNGEDEFEMRNMPDSLVECSVCTFVNVLENEKDAAPKYCMFSDINGFTSELFLEEISPEIQLGVDYVHLVVYDKETNKENDFYIIIVLDDVKEKNKN